MFVEWVAEQWEGQIDQVRDSEQSPRQEEEQGLQGPEGGEEREQEAGVLLSSILSGSSFSPAAALAVLIQGQSA